MMADENKKKGDFLENLVHNLYELAGDQVERDVQMLAIDDSGRTRQIDVLLSVAGEEFGDCPVRFPIECKNYGRKIGIQEIDSFVGKLNDIGIPPQFGIFVAVLSYTSDAMKRAKAAGIKLLNAERLTRDRLALEIQEVLHGVVFWVGEWTMSSGFPYLPSSAGSDFEFSVEVQRAAQEPTIAVLDEIWKLWLSGQIPCEFGEHSIFVRYGNGQCAVGDVRVSAHGASLKGRMTSAGLAEAETEKVERQHIHAEADLPEGAILLSAYTGREEMEEALAGSAIRLDVRTPRIIGPSVFWPPTTETMQRLMEYVRRGERPGFDELEGRNLLRAWAYRG